MRRLSLGVAVLAAAALLAPSAASAASWSTQSPINPATSVATSFGGVSCPASNNCIGVGRWDDGSGVPIALAEGWNGSAWSTQTLATPAGAASTDLFGVTCSATSQCTAVGNYDDGTGAQWALVERYTGSWALQTAPRPSGAQATYLTGVACSSSTLCTAVGAYVDSMGVQKTFALRWASGSWTVQATPNPSGFVTAGLSGVTCTSSTSCVASGAYTDSGGTKTLVLNWNGTTWSAASTPNVAGAVSTSLAGISCSSSSACTAVGTAMDSSFAYTPVAMRWNGTTWALQAVSNPAGAAGSSFSGVSCTSSTVCSAVGFSYTSGGVISSMAQLWSSGSWASQATPSPAGSTGSNLAAVNCRTTTECTALGHWFDATPEQKALALRYV